MPRTCLEICEHIHPHLKSPRYFAHGMRFYYCYTCSKSFPAKLGYYITDRMGRPLCPCCRQFLRQKRRSPDRSRKVTTVPVLDLAEAPMSI